MSDMIKIQVRQKIKSFGIRTHIKKERTHMSDMKIRRLFLAALWDVLFLAVAETVSWVSMRTYRVS